MNIIDRCILWFIFGATVIGPAYDMFMAQF